MQQFGLQPDVDIYIQQQFFHLEQTFAEFYQQHIKGINLMKDKLKCMDDWLKWPEGMDNRLQQTFDRLEHKDTSLVNINGMPNNVSISKMSNALKIYLKHLKMPFLPWNPWIKGFKACQTSWYSLMSLETL